MIHFQTLSNGFWAHSPYLTIEEYVRNTPSVLKYPCFVSYTMYYVHDAFTVRLASV